MKSKAGRITIKRLLENSASIMERSSCPAKAGHPVFAGVYYHYPLSRVMTALPRMAAPFVPIGSVHFVSENSVGVLPVTCRNACENAGTLA